MVSSKNVLLAILALFISGNSYSQNLEELLESESKEVRVLSSATFKSTRIINGHSIEQSKLNQLDFRISHRFGTLNEGAYGLFGLDYSTIHFSLEYGITDWLNIGLGRASQNKTYDTFAKLKILRQSNGLKTMPISLSYVTSIELNTLKSSNFILRNDASRLNFIHQFLIARKFNENLSIQLSPTFIHRNLVKTELDKNDIYALGIGARYKLSKRVSLNGEYFLASNSNNSISLPKTYNVMSLGIDLETGGHVFQIMITNSQGMREGTFVPKTTENWFDGDIHLGFNISRVFSL